MNIERSACCLKEGCRFVPKSGIRLNDGPSSVESLLWLLIPSLTGERQFLLVYHRSGQVEEWAWTSHHADHPALAVSVKIGECPLLSADVMLA